MNINEYKVVKYLIKFICISVTFVFVGFWLYRYFLDKDSSVIESRYYFEDPGDVFPVMSMCFEQPFNEKLFQEFGNNISGSNYKNFLFGKYFDDEMTKINYASVTTNITDFILGYEVEFRNGTKVHDTITNIGWKELYYTFTWNSWGTFVKCFCLEITNKHLYFVRVFLKREIFPGSVRNSNGRFAVLFHYPNQVLASMQTVKRQWIKRENSTNHYMSFNLKGLDVNMQRYKKHRNNCILNWKNYDNITLENHLNKVGCKTPDQISNDSWSICTSQRKMIEARLPLNSNNVRPCKEVESIDYDMGETEWKSVKRFQGQYWNN